MEVYFLVLILNTMGMLSRSYSYANLAYVGGGFNDGIHNILEPAVFYIPVSFFGSDFHKFNEAVDLIQDNSRAEQDKARANHQLQRRYLHENIRHHRDHQHDGPCGQETGHESQVPLGCGGDGS